MFWIINPALKGEDCKSSPATKFGSAHRFVAADLDGNGSPEYLFADDKKLTIFSTDGKKTGEHSFPDVISETPFVSAMGAGNTKIGVVIKGENKVYLLDRNGTVMRGLPHNPVKAELVANPEDYLYSSARDYSGEKGLVEILFV